MLLKLKYFVELKNLIKKIKQIKRVLCFTSELSPKTHPSLKRKLNRNARPSTDYNMVSAKTNGAGIAPALGSNVVVACCKEDFFVKDREDNINRV